MSLGLSGTRSNSRRRRFFRGVLIAVVLSGLGIGGYVSGSDLARREVSHLRDVNNQLSERVETLTQSTDRLQALAKAAQEREREWRDRYGQDVPTGKIKALLSLVETHLAAGADLERIELFVDAAARAPVCDNRPRTKRFLVRTSLYAGPNDSVSFAANALTVTASGEAATDVNGNPEAWFDPAKPLTLQVTAIDGNQSEAIGPLPLHHAIVWGDTEYRFSAVKGAARGFVHVTADRCTIAD